jgi:hypothetical protein
VAPRKLAIWVFKLLILKNKSFLISL